MPEIVTTYLQMTSLGELAPARAADLEFAVREAVERDWRLNRSMYLLVGGQWSWIDKLGWSDEDWKRFAADERLRTFVASWQGVTAGYYELRRDEAGAVEVATFGLAPDFIGRGLGGALLTDAPLVALSRYGSGGVPTVLGLTVKSPTFSSSEPGMDVSCLVVRGYDARLAR